MADALVQILLRAKNEASKELKQVGKDLAATKGAAGDAGKGLNNMGFSSGLAKAALLGLAGGLTFVVSELMRMENELNTAATAISNISSGASGGVAAITAELKTLMKDTGASAKDVGDSLQTVRTSFSIFDVKDEKGIAKLLIDWKTITGQNFKDSGSSFRDTVVTYFGAGSDMNKLLPDVADKILAVAKAVHTDPASLSKAIADGGSLFKNAFGDLDNTLKWIGSIGAASGDVAGTALAVKSFITQVDGVIESYKKGGKPDEKTKAAFEALGIGIETVQNQSIKVGDKIMASLKNAMSDGKLSDTEIEALNFLFGGKIGEDMAIASNSIQGFQTDAEQALKDYKGTLEQGVKDSKTQTDKLVESWNKILASVGSSTQWSGIKDVISGVFDAISGIFTLDWKTFDESFTTFGTGLFKLILGADPKDVANSSIWWWDNVFTPGVTAIPDKIGGFFGGIWTTIKKGVGDAWALSSSFWGGIGADVWKWIKTAVGDAISGAQGVAAWATNQAKSITDGLANWLAPIGKWAADIWTTISGAVSTAIKDTSSGVSAWAKNRWTDLKTGFDTWLKPLGDWAGGLWETIKTGFNTVFTSATGVAAWLLNRWTDFRAELGKWYTGLLEVGGNLLKGLIKGMGDAWNDLKNKIEEIGGGVLQTFKDIFKMKSPSVEMADIGGYLLEGLTNGLKEAYPEVVKYITDISGMILGIWNDGKPKWLEFGKFIGDQVKAWGKNLTGFAKIGVDAFASFAQFIGGEAANGFKDFGSHFKDFLNQMITGLEVQMGVQAAAGIATSVAQAPLTFGASLLAIPAILGTLAAEMLVLEGARALINSFDVGTPYVPSDQLAQIHQGEMIVPKTFADGIRNGDVNLGNASSSQQPIYVQVFVDGQAVQESISRRTVQGTRMLVRDNLNYLGR